MKISQYSRRECLEVVKIPTSIPNDLLEANVSNVFGKLGVHVEGKDIQAYHRLKDFPEGTKIFINQSLCAY